MPQIEHGLYEPGEDVRAFEDDEDEAENSRLPLLIVLALLVLAMFGGFVWLAYNEGVARGRSENPLFASDQGPSKASASTGSSQSYRGFKIYEQPAPPDDDAGVTGQTAPAAATPAQSASAETSATSSPSAIAAAKPALAAKPKPVAAPKRAQARVPAVTAKAPTTATGAYVLQIGAYKSQAEADAAWARYKTRHASLLQGFGTNVVKADLGPKGIWYRLRLTGFAGKDEAENLCGRLKDDGGACFLGH